MHRHKLLRLLQSYFPIDKQELNHKKEILEFVTKNSDCFERSCHTGHITASGFLLNRSENQVLLMHHKKLGKWLQFGGHCDGDSDVLAVAIREAQEESGIQSIRAVQESIFDLDIHPIPKIGMDPAHLHFDIRFLLRIDSDEMPKNNHESHGIAWFSKDKNKLPANSESIYRMFDKWLQRSL